MNRGCPEPVDPPLSTSYFLRWHTIFCLFWFTSLVYSRSQNAIYDSKLFSSSEEGNSPLYDSEIVSFPVCEHKTYKKKKCSIDAKNLAYFSSFFPFISLFDHQTNEHKDDG